MSHGTLAVDIETASPFNDPGWDDFDDTVYFELVAIALGYQPEPDGPIETTVLFRRGGWDDDYTATLLEDAVSWCRARDASRTLTYNGDGFDAIHLRNWAALVSVDVEPLLVGHEDLKHPATERHGNRLPEWKDFPKFETLCNWEGVETTPTYYSDYNLETSLEGYDAIDSAHSQGKHIGQVLGELYVDGLDNGDTGPCSIDDLERLISHYATGDIEPLFELDRLFNRPEEPV